MLPGEWALLIMISITSIVGTVGNLLLLIFIARRYVASRYNPAGKKSISGNQQSPRLTTHFLIMVLAANDLIASLVVMPLTLFHELWPESVIFSTTPMCFFYQFVMTSVIPFSAFLIISISFDRFACICYPLKTIITPLRCRVIVCCLAITASVMGFIVAITFISAPILDPNRPVVFKPPSPFQRTLGSTSLAGNRSSGNTTDKPKPLFDAERLKNLLKQADDHEDEFKKYRCVQNVTNGDFQHIYNYIHNVSH